MDAAGDLAQVLHRSGELVRDLADLRLELTLVGRHHGLREAQLQAERDQALLGPVVQVPLNPPPGVIRGRYDPRPRGGQLGPALGVPDRRGQKIGKVGHPVGGAGRKRPARRPRGHYAPQAALDDDRASHH